MLSARNSDYSRPSWSLGDGVGLKRDSICWIKKLIFALSEPMYSNYLESCHQSFRKRSGAGSAAVPITSQNTSSYQYSVHNFFVFNSQFAVLFVSNHCVTM